MAFTTHTTKLPHKGVQEEKQHGYISKSVSWLAAELAIADVVAAPAAGYQIVVHALHLEQDSLAANVLFDGATAITAFYDLLATGSHTLSFSKVGWFACAAATALRLDPNNGVAGNGSLTVVYSIQKA